MIEVVAAVSAASSAFNAIKKGFEVGRDIESMAGDMGRWMGAVSDIKKAEEYKGVADFLNFLNDTKVQAASHQRTGYLPVTMGAYKLTEASGFYEKNPGTDVAVTQMIRKATDKSRGIRLGNFVQVRAIIDEETEQIWSGKKTPKEALDTAVTRGNEQLARFARANR